MNLLFSFIFTRMLVSAFLVLRSYNSVRTVFFLCLVFLHASALLLLLGLEYFSLLLLLVYLGALAILFLFVIMLLDIPQAEITAHQRGTYPAALILRLLFSFFFLLSLWQPSENSPLSPSIIPFDMTLDSNENWSKVSLRMSNLTMLGVSLYRVHVDLLVLASLLLLVAMVGAVALTLKRRVNAPSHDSFAQHTVDFQKIVLQIQK